MRKHKYIDPITLINNEYIKVISKPKGTLFMSSLKENSLGEYLKQVRDYDLALTTLLKVFYPKGKSFHLCQAITVGRYTKKGIEYCGICNKAI